MRTATSTLLATKTVEVGPACPGDALLFFNIGTLLVVG